MRKFPEKRLWKRIVIFGLCVLAVASSTTAQHAQRGRIAGQVLDAKTGEPLYGANVLVKGTVLGAASNADGGFVITNLPAGTYDILASMMGYKKQEKQGIRVSAGRESTITFRLEPTVVQGPALVVTASKRQQNIEDAPTSVDVMSGMEIRARNVISLDEVLQNTAGLGIIKGQIDLRGSSGFNWAAGSRVLLMVDGHPYISGDTGGINWDGIPVEEVERVEVVKGAGSALYGSNAMAGMVNIITRDPTDRPETQFKLSWGFYDEPSYPQWRWSDRFLTYRLFNQKKMDFKDILSTGGIDLSHSRRIGRVGILVTAGRKKSSGYQENGDYSRWNLMGKMKIQCSPLTSLTITGNWALNKRGDFLQWASQDRALEVPPEALGDWVRSEKTNIYATFQSAPSQRLIYTLKANAYRYDWENHFHDNQDYAITDRIGFEAQGVYLWKTHSLTFGSEVTTHHANSLIYGNQDTWDYAVYAENEFKFSPLWTLTLGTRYDYHRIVGISQDQQISPRMGLVYRPWEGTSLRFSAGHGFRAPSIAEVFASISISGFRVVPNLDLKEAERAWSVELGMRQTLDLRLGREASGTFLRNPMKWVFEHANPSFIIDIAGFWSRYRNMIDVDINPELLAFQFVNLGKARNQGLEIRLMGSAYDQHLSTTFGYTLIDPEDLNTGETLNYRSRHRFNAGIQLKFWRLTLGWDYRYASRMENVVNVYGSDERVPMHVMDGRIIFDWSRIQISLEGKNLRNYHYTLRQRFVEPIRQYIVTLRGTI